MAEGGRTIVAGNGTVVEAGGVYLTYRDDPDEPYAVAKVISMGGGPGGCAMDCQLAPDLTPLPSPDFGSSFTTAGLPSPRTDYP